MKKRGCGATARRHSLLCLYWLLEIILPQIARIYTETYVLYQCNPRDSCSSPAHPISVLISVICGRLLRTLHHVFLSNNHGFLAERGCGATAGRHSLLGLHWQLVNLGSFDRKTCFWQEDMKTDFILSVQNWIIQNAPWRTIPRSALPLA